MRVFLVGLLASCILATAANAALQSVPVPGASWEIRLDAPELGARRDSYRNACYELQGRAGDLVLSLFVEPPANRETGHRACREHYWSRGSRNPTLRKDSVVISSSPRYERVEYILGQSGVEMRNVNYFFAHEGRWVDVHVSLRKDHPNIQALLEAFDRLEYGVPAQPTELSAKAGQAERVIPLPNRRAIACIAPADWSSGAGWPERGLPPTFAFKPAKGDAFSVKVTPIYRPDRNPAQPTDDDVKRAASAGMAETQPNATEQLEMLSWSGDHASGYYYVATDKAPKPGEYPYLLQGTARLDELLITYTVLLRKRDPATINMMLGVLKSFHRH